ncbi:MAG TPA: gliding motility-associated C-terminal domain-containing protein [Bacteroidia bacterium]|jgi:gliding motility-associated-like protein|nr:gliding motility-associated C-terminal domain-containing protein [Bacteroidia bacterium]
MKKIITLLSLVLISKFSVGQQDAALAAPSGSFTSPVTGCSLTSTENVTVKIFNYGPGSITTPFNVSYTINGGAPVTEMVAAPNIPQNTSYTYTFTTKADLSVPGAYSFDATVSVPGDPTPGNDTYTGYSVNAISPSIGGTITAPSSVCTSGNSGTLTLTGHTGSVLGWQYSTDGGGTWINISNTSTSQSYNNLTVATKYRVQVQNGACTPVYSAIATIAIDAVSVGGTITGATNVCISGNSGILTSGGGRVGVIQKWQYSLNAGATWIDTTATSTSIGYTNLTATRSYRVSVVNGSCPAAYSPGASILVNPLSVGGTTSPAATTVCTGSNSGNVTLSGHTGSILRWQSSTDGGTTWTNITNVSTTNAYLNIVTSTIYRAVVQSGACALANSSNSTITTASSTVAGNVTANATVCSGSNSGTLNLTGQTGSVQYWEFSTNGGTTWTTIANITTSQAYSNLTATTMYRANVKNGTCTAVNSGSATITVTPVSVGGTTAPKSQVCSGSNSGNITVSGYTGTIQNWESSVDGISWTPIVNATATQSYTNLTATTYYRAVVKSGSCASANSSIDTIAVDAPSVGGAVTSNTNICYGNNSGTLTLAGNNGTVVRWEFSLDNGTTYNTIANTTSSYSYLNLTSTSLFRAVVKNGSCNTANSSAATLTVSPLSVGGTVLGNATVCSGSNNGTLTLTGKSGTVQNWESSTNSGATWSSIANTTTILNYSNITATTYYRALVKSGACSNDTSSIAIVTVDAASVGGTLSSSDTVCKGANSGTLNLTGYTGAIQQWQFSTDGGINWLTLGNTTSSQAYLNLTTTTSYRVYVKNASCNGANSSVVTIKVEDPVTAGTLSAGASYCDTINNGTITLTGSVGTILRWEYSTDGGTTWTAIANTTTSQAYTNLKVTTQYRAVIGNVGCGNATSTVTTIAVSQLTDAGTLSANDTVCAGVNTGTLKLTGYVGAITSWEQSINGGATWTTVANTKDSLVYSNLTTSTAYRVLLKSGTCSADTSNVVSITVNPIANGGTLNSLSFCDTINSGTLTLTGSSGTIQGWESSADGGITWSSISNVTTTLNLTNIKDTTWYRVLITTSGCGNDTSTIGVVYVNPKPVVGTLLGSATVCAGANAGKLKLTGYVGIIDSWESSVNGGTSWLPISNTTDSLVYNNLATTTLYHVKVRNGNCVADTSARAQITVNPLADGGSVANVIVCDTMNSGNLVLTGAVGTVDYWQQSKDGGVTWDSIGVKTNTLSYTNIKDTTLFRAIVITGCSRDTSTIGTFYVNPNTIAGTVMKADSVCSGINGNTLRLTGYRGIVKSWQKSTDDGIIWTDVANTSDSLVYSNLTQSTLYRAIVQNGSCTIDTSVAVKIYVYPTSVGGNISAGSSGACEGSNGGTLTLTNYFGSILRWESSIDGGTTWTAIANTLPTYTYSNIPKTTSYRAIVQNGNCTQAISTITTISLIPSPVALFTADTVCEGTTTVFKNLSTISTGAILYSIWNFGDGTVSLSSNPTHTYAAAGTYDVNLQLTSNLGCTDTIIKKVIVNALPPKAITSSNGKYSVCIGDSIKLMATAGTYNYLWNSTYTTKDITVKTTGQYKLVITDPVTGCAASDSVNINVFNPPILDAGIDTSISLGSSVVLMPVANTAISTWSWFPSTGLSDPSIQNPTAMPLVNTTYNVLVIDVNGCMASDSVTVKVLNDYKVIIANLMTPNGDGYNDTWIIENIENYPHTQVTILTRQGQEVYTSNSYDNKWDGTQDGKKLADGTYYYVIKFEGSSKVLKGAVTILGQK